MTTRRITGTTVSMITTTRRQSFTAIVEWPCFHKSEHVVEVVADSPIVASITRSSLLRFWVE